MENDSIFVSIASYKDPELEFTLNGVFAKADHPERVFVGICQQHEPDKFISSTNPNAQFINFNYIDSRGACWARWHAHQFYRGEKYFIQLDSHIDLIDSWDTAIINQIKTVEGFGSKKALISTYPSAYELMEDGTRERKDPNPNSTGMKMDTLWPIGYGKKIIKGEYPVSSPFINAGLMFGHGSFYEECPYDPEIYFSGEEILNTLRAYTHGYDLYTSPIHIGWHLYKKWSDTQEQRKKWIVHWNEEDDKHRSVKWKTLSDHSRNKIEQILSGQIPGGFGNVRTLADYEKYINRPLLVREGAPY